MLIWALLIMACTQRPFWTRSFPTLWRTPRSKWRIWIYAIQRTSCMTPRISFPNASDASQFAFSLGLHFCSWRLLALNVYCVCWTCSTTLTSHNPFFFLLFFSFPRPFWKSTGRKGCLFWYVWGRLSRMRTLEEHDNLWKCTLLLWPRYPTFVEWGSNDELKNSGGTDANRHLGKRWSRFCAGYELHWPRRHDSLRVLWW